MPTLLQDLANVASDPDAPQAFVYAAAPPQAFVYAAAPPHLELTRSRAGRQPQPAEPALRRVR